MAYQVYFADLDEENRALILTLLKLKEEANELEPDEAEMLYALRGSKTPTPYPPMEEPQRQRQNQPRRSSRRPNNNGRQQQQQQQHSDN
jgi:hypothetical protein